MHSAINLLAPGSTDVRCQTSRLSGRRVGMGQPSVNRCPASWRRSISSLVRRRWDLCTPVRTQEALNDHGLLDAGSERSDFPSLIGKGRKLDEILQ